MRVLTVFSLMFLLFGCFEINREEIMKGRAEVKEAKPLEVSFAQLERQKSDLLALFNNNYVPLSYDYVKNPFFSIVEEYTLAQQQEKETTNPLYTVPLDEIKLAGILSGVVGNIAVVEVAGDTYYLKTGDSMGETRSTILFIGDEYIKVRDTSEDIFGNKHTEVKELKIDRFNEDKKEKAS
jgi:type IV pilus assembly protein PilP